MITPTLSPTYFFFWLVTGGISAYFAKKRGKNPYLWFAIGSFFGLFGLFVLFFMPKKKKNLQTAQQPSKEDEITIDITPEVDPTELEKLWYYLAAENKQHGPMSFDALKRAFREGKISDGTYVWNEQMDEWRRFGELFKIPTPIGTA